MRKIIVPVAVLLVGVALWAVGQGTIRVQVQLVSILATVKDQQGATIPNLSKDDFVVLDEGHPQDIRVFDRQAGTPLVIAMLVDASGSTAKDLRFEQDSAARFLNSIVRPQDRVTIYAFNHSVWEVAPFTNDLRLLERGLKDIRSEGGTSLYDAILLASEQLRRREGRRVIILITDGDDTTSLVNYHQALHAAQDADAAIYGVIVVPIPGSVGRDIGGEHAMITLAGDTGGRAFQPHAATELEPVFKDLQEELRSQYVLGFYAQPMRDTKPYRHLEVKSKNPAFTVQARKGYYFREDRK